MILKTENKELWETVQRGLQANKEKYGKRYCPCSVIRNNNTVCMCKEFKDSPSGTTCHCGIYTKV